MEMATPSHATSRLFASGCCSRCRQDELLQAVDANDKKFGPLSRREHLHSQMFCSVPSLVYSDYVELSLEMAITINCGPGQSSRGRFGTFDGLRNLLLSPNQRVVNLACASISRFCDKYGAGSSGNEEFSLLRCSEDGVVYGCDSCATSNKWGALYFTRRGPPFDLCRECFRLGTDYAATHEFSESQNVVIRVKL
jgi:hypothetical protein